MKWPPRRQKFGNVSSNGFGSKLESSVHQILKLRELAKEITDIRCQHAVFLTDAQIRTKMDFSYVEIKTDVRIYVEAKGVETERWRMIEKLWRFYGPGDLEIWKGDFRKPTMTDFIVPKIRSK